MTVKKVAANGRFSPAYKAYVTGKISSAEYFKRVRKATEKEVRRERSVQRNGDT